MHPALSRLLCDLGEYHCPSLGLRNLIEELDKMLSEVLSIFDNWWFYFFYKLNVKNEKIKKKRLPRAYYARHCETGEVLRHALCLPEPTAERRERGQSILINGFIS